VQFLPIPALRYRCSRHLPPPWLLSPPIGRLATANPSCSPCRHRPELLASPSSFYFRTLSRRRRRTPLAIRPLRPRDPDRIGASIEARVQLQRDLPSKKWMKAAMCPSVLPTGGCAVVAPSPFLLRFSVIPTSPCGYKVLSRDVSVQIHGGLIPSLP
jgi:hypothetical protein